VKTTVYVLLVLICLTITAFYFLNGTAVITTEPVASLPESPWVLSGVEDASGAELFASCASCHMADGSGRSDGEVPRLAGQSEKILVHKLQKLRDGSSYLPVMVPFARALTLAGQNQVARYMAGLSNIGLTVEAGLNGHHEVPSAYQEYCAGCHGSVGEGNDALLAPKLCGQHSTYLVRRMTEIKQNIRGDADAAMISVLKTVSQNERQEIAQWLEAFQCTAGQDSSEQLHSGSKS